MFLYHHGVVNRHLPQAKEKNIMTVKVLRLGHQAREVTTSRERATIQEILEANGIPSGGYSVTINGMPASFDTEVASGDVIALTPKVQGGQTIVLTIQ
jgi:sulfur carrier protein ThiS